MINYQQMQIYNRNNYNFYSPYVYFYSNNNDFMKIISNQESKKNNNCCFIPIYIANNIYCKDTEIESNNYNIQSCQNYNYPIKKDNMDDLNKELKIKNLSIIKCSSSNSNNNYINENNDDNNDSLTESINIEEDSSFELMQNKIITNNDDVDKFSNKIVDEKILYTNGENPENSFINENNNSKITYVDICNSKKYIKRNYDQINNRFLPNNIYYSYNISNGEDIYNPNKFKILLKKKRKRELQNFGKDVFSSSDSDNNMLEKSQKINEILDIYSNICDKNQIANEKFYPNKKNKKIKYLIYKNCDEIFVYILKYQLSKFLFFDCCHKECRGLGRYNMSNGNFILCQKHNLIAEKHGDFKDLNEKVAKFVKIMKDKENIKYKLIFE